MIRALAQHLPSLSRASSPSPKTATQCIYKWKAWKLRTQLFIIALDSHSHTWDYRAVQKHLRQFWLIEAQTLLWPTRPLLVVPSWVYRGQSSLNSLLFSPLSDRLFFTKSWLHINQQRGLEWVWGEFKYWSLLNPIRIVLFWRLDVKISYEIKWIWEYL